MPDSPTYTTSSQDLATLLDSETEIFRTPLVEALEPLLQGEPPFNDHDTNNAVDHGESIKRPTASTLKVPQLVRKRRTLRRSKSDQSETRRGQIDNGTDSAQTVFRLADANGNGKSPGDGHITPPYNTPENPLEPPSLRRPASNSALETKITRRGTDQGLQHRLFSQARDTTSPKLGPWRIRRVRTASVVSQRTKSQSPGAPTFQWFPVRSNSDPSSIPQIKKHATKRGKDLPLKPSLKQKSKSAAATPPTFSTTTPEDTPNDHKRRVKNVDFDFEETSRKLLSLPLLKVWTRETTEAAQDPPQGAKPRGNENKARPKSSRKGAPSPWSKTKSRPADPAITRTDVHVVAIAPSWGPEPAAKEPVVEPATPTMQIVESKAGCYEVIWDNVPYEDSIRAGRRRSSSASRSLRAASISSSAGVKGLERVNSKLEDWSWGRDVLAAPFMPQIVVFPDEDGRSSMVTPADDNYAEFLFAPPNSERTSAATSSYPSQSNSRRISRSVSSDEPESDMRSSKSSEGLFMKTHTHVEQNPSTAPLFETHQRTGNLLGASGRVKRPLEDRRLSNTNDSDVKFRGHRDSVTLARSRVFNAGGVSPEVHNTSGVNRHSVFTTKKRMDTGHHITSPLRDASTASAFTSDPLSPIGDAESEPSTPTVQSGDPPSMPTAQGSKNRRIRIMV